MWLLKVGGNELDQPAFLAGLATILAGFDELPVIVHGGGRTTSALMTRLGMQPTFVDGLRVTDPEALELVIMGLVGEASTRLVRALVGAGLPALGLSGVDARLVRAAPVEVRGGALGAVGRPVEVDVARLRALLDAGFLPCIAPVSYSEEGYDILNVNADAVAAAVATALPARRLVYLTNVPAVRVGGQEVARLDLATIEAAIARGEIAGGMIPKCRGAIAALERGVARVVITDLEGLGAIARGEPAGSEILSSSEKRSRA